MKTLDGTTAFITGGGSGIGFATAKALAGKGVRLVLADIDQGRVDEAAGQVRAFGGDVLPIQLNVAEEAEWARAGETAKAFGDIRILFSNAGVGGGSGKFEDYDTDVWRWNYAVNAHAHLYACRTFLGDMKASGEPAHVVITSSMVGIVPPPISIAYISSKFATLGIAMGLRNELQDTGVGISVLCPGMSATRIVRTTRELRPGGREEGAAATTSAAMDNVLAGGMSPEPIGRRVVKAIENDDFYIFTHPEWKRLAEPQIAEMLAAFRESADPGYKGDDIDSLIAANGARRMNASVAG
jgi:NAD(P)-dependent dehydrogenase (short-subunit alcohol dehydrogenase family)